MELRERARGALIPLLWSLVACFGSDEPQATPTKEAPTEGDTVVVLVSWDTTRADALGAYGNPRAHTPTADGLAARGVRFSWALAHAPTTLSSHAAMFSGTDSHDHGVVRNGYPVPAELPLVTEQFAAAGWDTLAVVGSTPLDESMGLSRGFRLYDDIPLEERVYEHDAKRVTDRALSLLDQRDAAKPLFLFVHYYDPHTPWTNAPDDVKQRFLQGYSGPVDGSQRLISAAGQAFVQGKLSHADAQAARGHYLAEVSWADQHLGRLLTALSSKGLDNQLVVLTSDHGEALDDAWVRPYGHGDDVDLVAIHVPLILWATGEVSLPAGKVVDTPVRLMDLAPTLMSMTGLQGGIGKGRDLSPLWGDAPPTEVPASFAEATKPLAKEAKDRWNNLPFERAVIEDGHLLIVDPLSGEPPRLFGLSHPQRPVDDVPRGRKLVEALKAWDSQAPAFREGTVDPAIIEGLRALGYVE